MSTPQFVKTREENQINNNQLNQSNENDFNSPSWNDGPRFTIKERSLLRKFINAQR